MIKLNFKHILILSLLSFGRLSCVLAQEPVKVILNRYVQDEKNNRMQSLIPVFKYPKMPLEDPVNIGVKTNKSPGTFTAKLPNLSGYKDTEYAYIYYGGILDRPELRGYVLCVISQNKRQFNKPAYLWIDRNYNNDLTDDGGPDTFPEKIGNMDIVFFNPKVKNATYTVNIARYPLNFNSKYIALMDDFYNENSGTKFFSGTQYSFKEQRLNTIAGEYYTIEDSFTIAIKDNNCNGLYNDPKEDLIIIGDYNSKVMSENGIPVQDKAGKTFFEKNGKRFNITFIDPVGGFVMVQVDKQATLTKALTIGKKLKKFKFYTTDLERKSVSIRKYRKKPTYIYIWRFDQPGFAEDTIALRIIARDYAHKIQLLTLNYGETPKEIRNFIVHNDINWTIGLSTQNINNQLYLEKFPLGVLTAKRLKVKDPKISPKELLILLKNNQI